MRCGGKILVLKLICLENKSEIGEIFNHYDLDVIMTLISSVITYQQENTFIILYTYLLLGWGDFESRDLCQLFTLRFSTYCKPSTFQMYIE